MRTPARMIPIALAVLAAILAVLGSFALAAVLLILAVGGLVFSTMRQTAVVREEDPTEMMDPDSRALFAPIRRLTREIEEIIEKNKDSFLMKTVGSEALIEAKRIREQVGRALVVRGELRRAMRGRSVAAQAVDDLTAKVAEAQSDTERIALQSAAEARQLELGHYASVEETLARIDANVRQAEAALSEIRARLAVGASGETAARADQVDDLRDTMGRLKALSVSVDEAEQMLRGTI